MALLRQTNMTMQTKATCSIHFFRLSVKNTSPYTHSLIRRIFVADPLFVPAIKGVWGLGRAEESGGGSMTGWIPFPTCHRYPGDKLYLHSGW